MLLDDRVKQFNKLVERIAHGDIAALDEIYQKYGGLLHAMTKKYLTDKSLSEDVLSEVFCKIVRSAKSFNKSKNGLNWVFKIVKNACIDRNKLEVGNNAENIEDCNNLTDFIGLPDNQIDNIDLRSALETLSDTENKILYLKYWEGLTVREIAKQLHKPKSTIQYIINQSLKKISEYMDTER